MSAAGQLDLSDRGHRERAATLFDANLVITAGAGTGKTALLVERALNLIAGKGVPVPALAAITFTEKAAAELRQRLAAGLDELRDLAVRGIDPDQAGEEKESGRSYRWLRAEGGLDAGTILQRSRAALTDLDAAQVTTIHAFCAEILRRYPREAGVDPSFVVDEGETFASLFEEEWEHFLLEELGAQSRRENLWQKVLLIPESLSAVRELARSLAMFGIPDEVVEPGAGYRAATAGQVLGDEIVRARDAALDAIDRSTGVNPNMLDFLSAIVEHLNAFLAGGRTELVTVPSPVSLDKLLTKSLPSPGKNMTGMDPEAMKSVAGQGRALVRLLERVDEEAAEPLVEAALPLASRARERLLASGAVSFDGLLSLTRDLLERQKEIRKEVAGRFEAILVDEFQDTDPLQYEILFYLAEEVASAADDAWKTKLAHGKLFIVGDPKQSIYRFRGADMEAYRHAVERVLACGGEQLTLSASFRSPSEIVDPVNRLFDGWIGPASDAERAVEPPYEPITSARGAAGAGEGPRVEIWSVEGKGNAAVRRRAEGDAVAAWIAENLGKEQATGTALACKDVAILLRALTNADIYGQALRRAGIPFVVEGGRGFYERREVSDLIAFLRAAANPADGASLLAVLRSPLGATPDAELARYAAAGGRLDRAVKNEVNLASFPNVQRTFTLLRSFREKMTGRPVDEIIRSVLTGTPLLALHASCFEGAQRVANMGKLAARGEDLARRGLSLEETLRFIDDEYRDERAEGESPLADETVDAVRILSVHKAKGLEYPVVIAPDVGRSSGQPNHRGAGTAWVRKDGEGFLAVRLPDGRTNLAWAHHAERDRKHDEAEEKRILYVATTRARERLILANSNPDRRAPWRDALQRIGYEPKSMFQSDQDLCDGTVRHRAVSPRTHPVEEPADQPASYWSETAELFRKTARSAARAAVPPLRWPSGAGDERAAGVQFDPQGSADSVERDTHTPPQSAVLIGSAVHAALELCRFGDWSGLAEIGRTQATRAVRAAGKDADVMLPEVTREVVEILNAFAGSPLAARLKEVDVLGRETPLIYKPDGEDEPTWLGACDLLYRGAEGEIVVADYKTDRIIENPEGQAERYRPQMGVYIEALRKAFPGETVRGEIIFLRAGVTVPVEAP